YRAHEPSLRSGGRHVGGALLDRRAARVWRYQLPTHRADTGRHFNVLRCGARARVATQHHHEWKPALTHQCPPMVRRFTWPLGGQYAGDRRDELQFEGRFSGLTRELAFGRTLDAHWAK